jgi:hypothetical protein
MKAKILLGTLLILAILVTGIISVAAAPSANSGLQFYPSKVHFADEHTLAVTGTFCVWPWGTYTPHISDMDVVVKVSTSHGWHTINGTVHNINVNTMTEQTFYIYNVNKVDFSNWVVDTRY